MRWVLMVQDLLPTAMSRINCKVEAFLKKWWSLPRSTSRDALRLALGMPSLIDLSEQGQLLKHHIAQNSKDRNAQAVWAARKARNHKTIRNLISTFGPILPASRKAAKRTPTVPKIARNGGEACRPRPMVKVGSARCGTETVAHDDVGTACVGYAIRIEGRSRHPTNEGKPYPVACLDG